MRNSAGEHAVDVDANLRAIVNAGHVCPDVGCRYRRGKNIDAADRGRYRELPSVIGLAFLQPDLPHISRGRGLVGHQRAPTIASTWRDAPARPSHDCDAHPTA